MLTRSAARRIVAPVLLGLVFTTACMGLRLAHAATPGPSATPTLTYECTTVKFAKSCQWVLEGGGSDGGSGSTPASGSSGSGCATHVDADGVTRDCNGCHWTAWTSIPPSLADDPTAIAAYDQWLADGQTGVLNMTDCQPGDVQTLYYIKTVSPGSNAWISRAAFAFPTITPHTWPGPSHSRLYNQTLVNVPTYLWIDPAVWDAPLGADVTSPDGAVTVHAQATAATAVWTMGDAHGDTPQGTLTCAGTAADVAYYPGIGASPCMYTYRRSSANRQQFGADPNDRPNHVTVTITWNVTWTCVSGCDASGSTTPVTTTATLDLVVAEIQTVIVG